MVDKLCNIALWLLGLGVLGVMLLNLTRPVGQLRTPFDPTTWIVHEWVTTACLDCPATRDDYFMLKKEEK